MLLEAKWEVFSCDTMEGKILVCPLWDSSGRLAGKCKFKGLWGLSVTFCSCFILGKRQTSAQRHLAFWIMTIAGLQLYHRGQASTPCPSKCFFNQVQGSTSGSTSGYYLVSHRCNKCWRVREKPPNSLWLSTRAPFGFAHCYWKYLCFPLFRSSGHLIVLGRRPTYFLLS